MKLSYLACLALALPLTGHASPPSTSPAKGSLTSEPVPPWFFQEVARQAAFGCKGDWSQLYWAKRLPYAQLAVVCLKDGEWLVSPRKALSLGHYDQETSVIGEGTSPSNNILNPNLNEEAFYDFIYRVSKPISSEMILGSLGGDQLNVPTVDLRTDSLVNKEGKKLPMIDLPTHGLRMVANSGGIHGYSCAWPAKFSLKKIISSRGPFVCGWLNGPQAKVDIDMMYFGVDSTSRVVVRIHDNKLVDGKPVPHPQPFDTYKTYLAIFKFITSTRNP